MLSGREIKRIGHGYTATNKVSTYIGSCSNAFPNECQTIPVMLISIWGHGRSAKEKFEVY